VSAREVGVAGLLVDLRGDAVRARRLEVAERRGLVGVGGVGRLRVAGRLEGAARRRGGRGRVELLGVARAELPALAPRVQVLVPRGAVLSERDSGPEALREGTELHSVESDVHRPLLQERAVHLLAVHRRRAYQTAAQGGTLRA
jgi:hypothetical protein